MAHSNLSLLLGLIAGLSVLGPSTAGAGEPSPEKKADPAAPAAPTTPTVPTAPVTLGEGVFDPAPVLRIHIEIPEAGIEQLRLHPKSFVKAVIREGDTAYSTVGVHLKGSVGSFQPVDSNKPGFSLKFDRWKKSQHFHGLKKVILNNCVQDPTYLQEWVGNELFRAAGVPAPRIGWAVVDLNGNHLGLYVVCEAITSDFLSHWFGDASGNLYEGPPDITSERLDVDSHGGVSDRADLKALLAATKLSDTKARLEELEKVLDLDRFISFAAMEDITGHWDGYVQGRNNYHLYHDPKSGKMVFLPHGVDQLFQNPQYPLIPTTNGVVAKAVLKTGAGRSRYRGRVRKLLDEVLRPEKLRERILELAAKLNPVLRKEGLGAALSNSIAVRGLIGRIEAREQSLKQQLAGQVSVLASPLGPAVRFDADGRARLSGWQPRSMGGLGEFQRVEGQGERGGAALRIDIPPGGQGRSSWRRSAALPPGHYRLLARIRTQGVIPSDFGLTDGGRGGADVRISGDQPDSKLSADNGWTTYEFRFDLEPEEGLPAGEQPLSQVELVCELQASGGTAWFDEGSLELWRKSFDT